MTKRVRKDSLMKDQGRSSKRKREDMKPLKLEGAEKRSSRKQRRTKFPFSIGKIARPGGRAKVVEKKLQRRQCGLQVELMEMESELTNKKGELRDSKESLLAVKIGANQSQAQLEQTRNELNQLMDDHLEMKAAEAFLMHELGIF